MANILMVNPSVNMRLTAMELKMYGNNVEYAYTEDIPYNKAERVFYFLSGVNICFTTEVQGEMEREDRVFLFKQNLFSRFKMMGYKKNLALSYPELNAGNFVDLVLFKRSVLRHEELLEHDGKMTYSSLQDLLLYNKHNFVITNYLINQGNESVCIWETDFDLVSTFSNDYFVFFAENKRIEAFVYNNKLVTIGKGNGEKHLDALINIEPFLNKFKFNKLSEKNILRNFQPWPVTSFGYNGYLINDYSFGHLSVSMPSAWYDKLANFINSHILKGTKKEV